LIKNKYKLYLKHLLDYYFLSEIQNPAMCLRGNCTYTRIIRQCVAKMSHRVITYGTTLLFLHVVVFLCVCDFPVLSFQWSVGSEYFYMFFIKLIPYTRISIQLCCTPVSRYVLLLSL